MRWYDGQLGPVAFSLPATTARSAVDRPQEGVMATRKPHIIQDERGQDQPTSKRAAHHTEPTMPKDASEINLQDIRTAPHDPIREQVRPHPDQVPTTPHEVAEPDVAPAPEPSHADSDLPEGLLRPRTGPYGPTKGRR